MEKTLFIVRGLPGSGKSTFSNYLCLDTYWEADLYYIKNGKYEFDPSKIGEAHKLCQQVIEKAMQENHLKVGVGNTSTTEQELKPYLDMAKKYNYKVFSIIIENRHGNESIHNVPLETIEKMRNRFNIKL